MEDSKKEKKERKCLETEISLTLTFFNLIISPQARRRRYWEWSRIKEHISGR